MILKFIGWLFVALLSIALIIIFLPLIILVILIAFIVGLFSRPTVRVWASRAQAGAAAGAQTVQSKISEHAPMYDGKAAKPGQRRAKVVDADTVDVE